MGITLDSHPFFELVQRAFADSTTAGPSARPSEAVLRPALVLLTAEMPLRQQVAVARGAGFSIASFSMSRLWL